jgi:uncharacterized membrane protein YedE/YeeE
VAAVALGVAVQRTGGTRALWLYVLGLALGVALFHSRFGFTSAWRRLVTVGQGRALRAHILMLGVACVLFAPILSGLVGFGGPKPVGNIEPISAGLFIGAFAFGVGMQLGGSCASGTLFAIGSGQSAIVLTLAGFVTGSVLGTATFSFWTDVMPVGPEVSLAESRLGYGGALVAQLAIMAAIAPATLAARGAERRNAGRVRQAVGHHLRHGLRHHARRARGVRGRRHVRAAPQGPVETRGGRDRRRHPHGVRRAHRVRLQHRVLLQRHRVVQPARLDLGRHGAARHVRRGGAASADRPGQPEAH